MYRVQQIMYYYRVPFDYFLKNRQIYYPEEAHLSDDEFMNTPYFYPLKKAIEIGVKLSVQIVSNPLTENTEMSVTSSPTPIIDDKLFSPNIHLFISIIDLKNDIFKLADDFSKKCTVRVRQIDEKYAEMVLENLLPQK